MKKLIINFPDSYRDYGQLLLRVVFGLSMVYGHGWGKLGRLFGDEEIQFADPFGLGPVISLTLGVFAEFVCALLVTFGLFTRLATIPLIIMMGTAFFHVHLDQSFGQQEKAILFGFAFIAIFLMGPGKYSLDNTISKQSR